VSSPHAGDDGLVLREIHPAHRVALYPGRAIPWVMAGYFSCWRPLSERFSITSLGADAERWLSHT